MCNAQAAFKNMGSIQMHANASIGFHADLINDGNFENNQGLVGFYSDQEVRTVSGTNRAIFSNVEIDVEDHLNLENAMGITQQFHFVNGKVQTPRTNPSVSLDFISCYFIGENYERYTDGYASYSGMGDFTLPIGDDFRIRPLKINIKNNESHFNGAYFFENPNSTASFLNNFNTNIKQSELKNISNTEFWDLNGTTETTVTLTWDSFSEIASISPTLESLRVVGWSKRENKWIDLGGENILGDLDEGSISSSSFIPNNYEIITIGSIFLASDISDSENYLISANNDGMNDQLIFEGLETYDKNELVVFNRWGNIVFNKKKYTNNWSATTNTRSTINKKVKLPAGTYFYTLKYGNQRLDNTKKGWIYISY